jgi:hypothetical protein
MGPERDTQVRHRYPALSAAVVAARARLESSGYVEHGPVPCHIRRPGERPAFRNNRGDALRSCLRRPVNAF